jgi:hypothetical protein
MRCLFLSSPPIPGSTFHPNFFYYELLIEKQIARKRYWLKGILKSGAKIFVTRKTFPQVIVFHIPIRPEENNTYNTGRGRHTS